MRWPAGGLSLCLTPGGMIPWGTLAANLIGGYLIGVCVTAFQAMPHLDPVWRLALVTGFLGGLTTFSSFSAEVVIFLMDALRPGGSHGHGARAGFAADDGGGTEVRHVPDRRQRAEAPVNPGLCRSAAVRQNPWLLPQAAGIGHNRPWLP